MAWEDLIPDDPERAAKYPFAAKMAEKFPSLDTDDPWFIFQQEQQAWRQQQENQRQRALNQQARQQSAAQQAGLQLDAAQLQLQHQQNASRLLQDLLNARYQTMLANQSGARTLNDLAGRLLDTRFNVDRMRLQDQLRLLQMQDDMNRLMDTSATRALRLIGG